MWLRRRRCAATYYADNDSDGFGAGAPVPGFTCNVPSGHVTNNTDCNDSNPAIKPGAIELCNGIDDNCDGLIDNTNLGNGLVAYLSFNGTTSDGSQIANNGSAPAGSAYATGVNGTANGAFQFGGGRYVVLPHNAAYNLGTGDFTYSVWLNWSSTAYGSVIDKNNYSNGVFGLNCFVDYPGSGNFMARPGDVVTGTGLGNNTWHHVVTTRTGTTLRIYVNGALSITSTIASVNLNNTSNIFIGRHGNGAIQFYSGRMDNLRLYNRALSAAEVTELRNSELTGEVGGGTGILYYADQDGDGFGDPNSAQVSCTPIPGYVTNNTDGCPLDPLKQAPGACGCGNLEIDTDGDGTPNCIDGCPNDPLKIAPLACGCGNPETDGDGDSTPDCVDGCPSDPLKTSAGACGCGNPDTDSDGDGIANCVDNCPNTPGQHRFAVQRQRPHNRQRPGERIMRMRRTAARLPERARWKRCARHRLHLERAARYLVGGLRVRITRPGRGRAERDRAERHHCRRTERNPQLGSDQRGQCERHGELD
ncbi:MAG: hypothetical protein IPJ85_07970 [Flavobacteriales bacterium]|nr:hypothetical protein [Flavobacteriales bacterium]